MQHSRKLTHFSNIKVISGPEEDSSVGKDFSKHEDLS